MAKTLQYDLPVVASFAPDIVILQLGTNDLSRLDPLVVGSSIEELVTILHDTYNVKLICVCQNPKGVMAVLSLSATRYKPERSRGSSYMKCNNK